MHLLKITLLLTLGLTSLAFGHDVDQTPSPWDGSTINLGGVQNTGNTDSSNFTGALKIIYTKNRWTNTLNLNGQYGRSDGETNAQMYGIENKTQYSLNTISTINNFIYLDTDTVVNPFNSYDFTSTVTAGYGRDWVKNDKYTLSTSIAPGYNQSSIQNSDTIDNSWAAVGNMNILWNISSSTKLTDDSKLSFFETYWEVTTTAALNNKISGNLSLVLSHSITYFSEIPEGTDYTDQMNTITNVSLSYSF